MSRGWTRWDEDPEEGEWDTGIEHDELAQLDLIAEQEEEDRAKQIRANRKRLQDEERRFHHNQQILERARERRVQRWRERKEKEPLTWRQCLILLGVLLVLGAMVYC